VESEQRVPDHHGVAAHRPNSNVNDKLLLFSYLLMFIFLLSKLRYLLDLPWCLECRTIYQEVSQTALTPAPSTGSSEHSMDTLKKLHGNCNCFLLKCNSSSRGHCPSHDSFK
jgi:hypothetical protein